MSFLCFVKRPFRETPAFTLHKLARTLGYDSRKAGGGREGSGWFSDLMHLSPNLQNSTCTEKTTHHQPWLEGAC